MGRRLPPPAWNAPPADSHAQTAAPRPIPFLSYSLFAIALIAGLLAGLALSWTLGPLPQRHTQPHQLREHDQRHYMLAIAMEYQYSGNTHQALTKLAALRPPIDPFQALANAACALADSPYRHSPGGLAALSMTIRAYQSQGRAGCAEELLPANIAIPPEPAAPQNPPAQPSPTAPPSKTPAQASIRPSPTLRAAASPIPQRAFAPLPARTFCDAESPALIEVHIVDYLGRGIPGQTIRVRWGDNQDSFLSGLKPERGDAYADFQMTEGIAYAIDMPGASDSLRAQLQTAPCFTASGQQSQKSFRVTFRSDN